MSEPEVLRTTAGDLSLEEVQLAIGERTWSILHTGAVISRDEEFAYLRAQREEEATAKPYGIVLWPASIALAHSLGAMDLEGKRILELGAGTGLPGIVAASLGAHVIQTDRQSAALHVSKMNGARNSVTRIEHRIADWTAWGDISTYDLIIGSDILYAEPLHPFLKTIFETNLAPSGTLLIADPYRATSIPFLEALEAQGWKVTLEKWSLGEPPRPIGVFALKR